MFAVIQFPIADVRCFAREGALRLDLPSFPKPRTWGVPEFARCFGPAVDRRLNADPAWTDEQAYCRANRAIRFIDFHHQRLGPIPLQVIPSGVFRRLFSDGEVVTRVEVAISQRGRAAPITGLYGRQCLAVGIDFMHLPTKVTSFRNLLTGNSLQVRYGPTDVLVRQGHRLARLYCRATASERTDESLAAQEKLVEDGRPLAIVEFEDYEVKQLPDQARLVESVKVDGATVAFAWLETQAGLIGTWFIRRKYTDNDNLRRLRLCLLRLHAEREVLNLVIKQLRRSHITFNPKTEASDRLEAYLNNATRIVQRPQRFGISQSAILAAFDAAESVDRPADWQGLLQQYEGARRRVWRKVEEYEKSRGESRVVHAITYVDTGGGDYVEEKRELHTGDRFDVHSTQSQIGSIGSASMGTVSGTININPSAAKEIDVDALQSALKNLYTALGQANLSQDVLITAQTAAGSALTQGIKDREVKSDSLVPHIQQVGETLKQANTVVKEGTSLWDSVQKLASVLAPLVVGGARVIAAWFGVSI